MMRATSGRGARAVVAVVTGGALLAGAPASAGTSPTVDASPPIARTASTSTPVRGVETRTDLDARLRAAFGRSADDVSVVVHDRVSGRVTTYNPGLANCTGSIVKVMVLVALIEERRDTGRALSSGQRALARRMIHASDNDATGQLLRQAGGGAAIDRLAGKLGLTRTRSAPSWGRTMTTARDQVRLMDALVSGHRALRADDRAYVLRLMDGVQSDQRWGVGTVPSGVRAQVKNGWVPLSPRGWRVNSVGHVAGRGRDYTMAVLSYDNDTMGAGVAHADRASRIVFDALRPTSGAASFAVSTEASGRGAATPAFIPHPLW